MAHRLLGFHGLPYDDVPNMLQPARQALLKSKYRDNSLLPLDGRFRQKMRYNEDAVAYYFAGNGQQKQALAHLHKQVKQDGNHVYWQATTAWGGNLEVTADVARLMYHADDPLFRPAFAYVTSQLINDMLYSTADTRALVELLAFLRFDSAATAIIDGQEVNLNQISIGQEITALNDNLIVRLDEEIELNYLAPRSDFRFKVKPSQTRLKLGQQLTLTITPQEESIAPLARIFLPGNLALVKAGANAQTTYTPIEQKSLTLQAVAVRPGQGYLYVSIHDMYDAAKVGTIPGIAITVVEP